MFGRIIRLFPSVCDSYKLFSTLCDSYILLLSICDSYILLSTLCDRYILCPYVTDTFFCPSVTVTSSFPGDKGSGRQSPGCIVCLQ